MSESRQLEKVADAVYAFLWNGPVPGHTMDEIIDHIGRDEEVVRYALWHLRAAKEVVYSPPDKFICMARTPAELESMRKLVSRFSQLDLDAMVEDFASEA